MASPHPLRVAILWHMHQPNYEEPDSRRLVMPWVRLHATKDYLDMPLAATRYETVRTTFNLVPSLLDQFETYLNGGTDPHLELSRIPAGGLSEEQRTLVLRTFFNANPTQMVKPFDRYWRLYRKARNSYHERILPALFSSEEMRDIQVWSNLVWVDPTFRSQEPIRTLLEKQGHFTEADKHALLDWQIDLIGRIVGTYRALMDEGRIEVSFTPYYHPILPLLCDSHAAQEACPGMTLPRNRFQHPEDARWQIQAAQQKYQDLFGRPLAGMWPSEGSVSEEVACLALEAGLKWMATDEEILYASLAKARLTKSGSPPHLVYDFGPGLRLFFRDHALSDRIGFVYSEWDPDRAVHDFMRHLKRLRSILSGHLEQAVVPIILDGENAWEYYPDDGRDFLDQLYRLLEEDPEVETITMTAAAEQLAPRPLPSLFAGSWINHNFRIWIGHPEDNAAWDLLASAREKLVQFQKQHPQYDPDRISRAWRQIYIAEGSDWCWWYGDEHRGVHNAEFDRIFRRHLMAAYEYLGLEVPLELMAPIYRTGVSSRVEAPDAVFTPQIDGRVTHFYEWSGSGHYDCRGSGGTMHRVDGRILSVFFGFDHEYIYIRLDFTERRALDLLKRPRLQIACSTPGQVVVDVDAERDKRISQADGVYEYCLGDILEVAIRRSSLWSEGFGMLDLNVSVFDGEEKLETWPVDDKITLDVPEQGKELFWPT